MADSSNYRDRPSITITDPQTGRPSERNVPSPAMGISPQAIQNLFETQKMEDAEKALSAAIQFQGLRGYQQALKSGEAAEKAMTRYGPMMFYQRPTAVGSAIRSVTPPQMTPYQERVLQAREQRAAQPQIRSIPGGGFVSINPTNQAITTVREPTETGKPRLYPAVVARDRLRGDTRLPMTGQDFQTFMATAPPQLRTNAVNTAIGQMIQPPVTATNASPRVRRWNRQAGKFE